MPYRIAGIDVHKKMLAVVVADVEIDGDFHFERQKVGTTPLDLRGLADWLVEHGVARERITVIAIGEQRPVAPNAHLDGSADEEGRARNRRVTLAIAPPVDTDVARPSGLQEREAAPDG